MCFEKSSWVLEKVGFFFRDTKTILVQGVYLTIVLAHVMIIAPPLEEVATHGCTCFYFSFFFSVDLTPYPSTNANPEDLFYFTTLHTCICLALCKNLD